MAHPEEIISLTKAFSGLGVDEKVLISTLGKWTPEHIESYRKANANGEFFQVDEQHLFQRWTDHHVKQLHQQFIRFKNAVVLRTMHPWERDARLIHEALHHKLAGTKEELQLNVIVETACTRSAEELLGARKAYHSLFHHSIEEDIAAAPHINHHHKKLLFALVSAYCYEGSLVNEETAKLEAKILHEYCCAININNQHPVEVEEDMHMKIIFILATRSKPHLKAIYNHYKHISPGNSKLDEDLDERFILIKQAVECLCIPETYFAKVLEASLESNHGDESAKDTVTRVIVTQTDVNLKNIMKEYDNITGDGIALPKRVEELANGSYRDFLLALLQKE